MKTAAAVALLCATHVTAQDRFLTLAVGDAEDYGVELIDGANPINPTINRYCVRMPPGTTIDRYTGVAKRVGEGTNVPAASQSSAAISATPGAGGPGSASGPTTWVELAAPSASVYYVNTEGSVAGAAWEARPPRMFMRRDAMNRIHVCVGKPGMQPPTP
jgi:hypothetical protein